MFDIKMVTTDKNNRRSGLGTDLLRRSVQLAASLGYKVRNGGRKKEESSGRGRGRPVRFEDGEAARARRTGSGRTSRNVESI